MSEMSTNHRWQFSLRTLMLLVIPLAVVMAVSRLSHASHLWTALGVSLGYFGGCGLAGAVLGHMLRRKDGAIDGALVGLLVATLVFFSLTLAGW